MEELFLFQNKILNSISDNFYRSQFNDIDWSQRLLGIKGLRGVGKTTILLQYLKFKKPKAVTALYVTADHPWFYSHSLFELVSEFSKNGGQLLLIDEIHKYPNWARELKAAYDGNPDIQFVFTASSAFDIFKAEGDLSRRAFVEILPGLSFREYLEFRHDLKVKKISLSELLNAGDEISKELNQIFKPIPLFKEYIHSGYFPFLKNETSASTTKKLMAVVNTVLENDLAVVEDYSPSNIQKVKKLLGVIAGSAPFTPNITSIAQKLNVGRNTIYNFLKHLEDARILNLIHKRGRGVSVLQKPDKIYFENTNLALSLHSDAQTGALRETFFLNQLRNAGHTVELPKKADFLVDEHWVFEIGGENKTARQIRNIENAWLVKDNIEYATPNTLPLWMFGLLY